MSRREIVNDFIQECSPLLDSIVESIFMLKAVPGDKETLDVIFRCFHTIKSNAGIIDQDQLGDLCHTCEDALAEVRDSNREMTGQLVSSLMLALDYLNDSFIRLDADIDVIAIDSSIMFNLAAFIEG